MSSRPALVLDDPSLASEEVKVFANFPGRWTAGEAIAVDDLGFESADACYARVAELGLPLKKAKAGAVAAAAEKKPDDAKADE